MSSINKPTHDFNPKNFYTAIRKEIGDKADNLTPAGIRDAVRIYHPDKNLSDAEVKQVMKMYEDARGWG